MIADSAGRFGIRDVVLTGGCFANGTLLARAAEKLRRRHFRVFVNKAVPCGDGGISLGQAFYGLLCGQDGKER
jgi:hydrogenase maturation protein HypF